MRTTLKIDDDVYEAALALARSERKSLGEIVSRLARRGLMPRLESRRKGAFPVFKVLPGTKPLTPEMIHRALDDHP
jgi:predicted CopG family antitoxin